MIVIRQEESNSEAEGTLPRKKEMIPLSSRRIVKSSSGMKIE